MANVTYGNGATTDYAYENDSDLIRVNHGFAQGEAADFTYGYAPSAKLVSMSVLDSRYRWTPQAAATNNYTPNNLNQYADVNGTTFTHDLNGNLTSDGEATMIYDSENRLTGFSRTGTNPVTASFVYGPAGRRLEKAVNGLTTKYVYDGDHVVAETVTAHLPRFA